MFYIFYPVFSCYFSTLLPTVNANTLLIAFLAGRMWKIEDVKDRGRMWKREEVVKEPYSVPKPYLVFDLN
jgi:hypothetical protein